MCDVTHDDNAATTNAIAVQDYVSAFEALREDNIEEMLGYFAENARFIDPFNDVVGEYLIRKIFVDMFEKTNNPRFVIEEIFMRGDTAMLTWTFHFQFKKQIKAIEVYGSTKVTLNDQGKVVLHRDFWDPCRAVYEHVPFLGGLFRWLRRRLAV